MISRARSLIPDLSPRPFDDDAADEPFDLSRDARNVAPIVWLIGKVQSGKSSIIRVMTDSSAAEIGSGFKACTRTARVFDFPDEVPILRFLDTRGLGEVSYDPAEDMHLAERQAHLLLVTMRAMDPRQNDVIAVVNAVRRRHPDWPIVVAQTTLHEGYAPGAGHVIPYPFSAAKNDEPPTPELPQDLTRSLAFQRTLLKDVPGRGRIVFCPIDFTLPEDGLSSADYGMDALAEALVSVAPQAMTAALSAIPVLVNDRFARIAEPIVLGHAMAAAGSDLVPVAGAVAVGAVQTQLLRRLGQIYGVTWDRRTMAEFAAALGGGVVAKTLTGFGLRQLAKLIPVYGQTAAAAASAVMSFAVTYAVGKAAMYFLHRRRFGLTAMEGVAATYQQSLREALRLAKERKLQPKPAERAS